MQADAVARRAIFEKLKGYASFLAEYSAGHLPFTDDRYFYVHHLEVDGWRLAVLGLNSAWLAQGGPEDRGRLVLGEQQVRTAVREAGTATCALPCCTTPLSGCMSLTATIAKRC